MNPSLIGNLRETITHYRGRVFLAFLMVLISNILLVFNPLIFRQALLVLDPQTQTTQLPVFYTYLMGPYIYSIYAWALLLFIVAVISAVLKYYMRFIFISISREVELEVRAKLFDKIQAQSKAFFDRHPIGDLVSRLTNDITAYRDVLGPGLMYPSFSLTLVIPAFIALFSLSPLLALLSFFPVITIYLLNAWTRAPMYKISQQVQASLAEMSTMAQEHFSGIRVIKSYGIEPLTFKRFEQLNRAFSVLNMRFASLQGILLPLLTLITKTTTVLLVMLAGALILLGWSSLNMADFLSFMWIQSYIFGPLLMLGWILPMYHRGKAAYVRLVEIYEEPIDVYERRPALKHIPPQAEIEFRHLTFRYPNASRPAIKDISLSIKSESFVGITGPVGAGKTTLFRLLSREYEVLEGMILIGGRDIHDYSLEAFHQEMVSVEQLPFLFSKTIAENVRFGKQNATQEEIIRVAMQADLHETVLEFPGQYETLVGERGVSLSGGQKQRVAMARAFLVNRSILLLDDIFSAVDAETEQRIFQAMKENFKHKTILLITHRVSILEQLDRVIYMADGRIVEDDSPQELGQRSGPYKALVDLQKMQAS